ncbi:MAG: thiolase domain-containing protein [Elusimicrobia bacterium]|nr:thiolase domain-containing protein [Elusimicrobiota bacterium]
MPDVAIIGACETRHGILNDRSLRSLISEAGHGAIADAAIDRKDIQAVYVGNYAANEFNGQNAVAAFAATAVGLGDLPSVHLEGACASGGLAIRDGLIAIKAGIYHTVLVIGVEKMNTKEGEALMEVVGRGQDQDFEGPFNIPAVAGFALNASRHMHEFGTTKEHLAAVAEKNYYHGSLNPYAHKQRALAMERVLKGNSREVASPLGLHDISLVTDGAAAVVLTTLDRAKASRPDPVLVKGSGLGGDAFTTAQKRSSVRFEASIRAAKEAYAMAGLGPEDIDVVECHDCFTITEIINIEDLGFVEKGKGGPYTQDGHTRLGGKLPVNTSGGLKSKGHPVGCTGVGQVVEMTWQLRGQSGKRQVADAKRALTHVLGGPGAISAVHVLERLRD